MRKLTTREIVLLVVLALGGQGYLWYVRSGSSPLDFDTLVKDDGAYAASAAPVVELARLEGRSEVYDPGGRNLFKYSKPPEDPDAAARRAAAAEARRKAEEERQKRRQAQRNQPKIPATPQPPGIPLKFLGYFGPKDDKIAVFEDGDELYIAQVGEILQEQFRVVEIKYETVVMGYTDDQWAGRTRELNLISE
jgi:hypothetical protein